MTYALDCGIFVPQQPGESIASRFGPWYRKAKRIFAGAIAAFQDKPVYDPTTGKPMYSGTQGGVPMYGCAKIVSCAQCPSGKTPASLTLSVSVNHVCSCAESVFSGDPSGTYTLNQNPAGVDSTGLSVNLGSGNLCIYGPAHFGYTDCENGTAYTAAIWVCYGFGGWQIVDTQGASDPHTWTSSSNWSYVSGDICCGDSLLFSGTWTSCTPGGNFVPYYGGSATVTPNC